jgi:hypothetical protein
VQAMALELLARLGIDPSDPAQVAEVRIEIETVTELCS